MKRGKSNGCALGFALLALMTAGARAEEVVAKPYSVEPLLGELRSRTLELDRRERELADRERNVGELEAIVGARLREIDELRGTVESRIAAWEKAGEGRIGQLAKIYAAMPPGSAARLVEALDADLATQILRKMKHKDSAAVLALISKDRALLVSRQVARPLSFEPALAAEGGL